MYTPLMEGNQGHNSNTPYALFHLRYMDVNYALSQSDMMHTFFEMVFWIIPFGYCVTVLLYKSGLRGLINYTEMLS